ncbi:hypothetical protein N9053_00575 [bacterium]|nr:hypothetical protein [bacterium]
MWCYRNVVAATQVDNFIVHQKAKSGFTTEDCDPLGLWIVIPDVCVASVTPGNNPLNSDVLATGQNVYQFVIVGRLLNLLQKIGYTCVRG